MGAMTVAALAEELGVPPSAVIEQCQRFGIDASWAGAELGTADVAVLRSELAAGDAVGTELGSSPDDAAAGPDEATGDAPAPPESTPPDEAPAAPPLPPTAVGSIPELVDEAPPPAEATGEAHRPPGFPPLAGASGGEETSAAARPAAHPEVRLERAARNGALWLALALVLFAVAGPLRNPWAVAGLWLASLVCVLTALWNANRGRVRATLHPERLRGRWLSVGVLVVGLLALAGLGLSVVTAVGNQAAAEAPLSVGKLTSVQSARWGYHRLSRIVGDGWSRPAKDAGTCWREHEEKSYVREAQRVEGPAQRVGCDERHLEEIVAVFAYDRDADTPYPGVDRFRVAAIARCGQQVQDALRKAPTGSMELEYPTAAGWDDGDHDIACAVVTPDGRTGALAS